MEMEMEGQKRLLRWKLSNDWISKCRLHSGSTFRGICNWNLQKYLASVTACSSHHQIVIWISFWFDKLNQSRNSEMAMLSKFFWSRILSGAWLSCCNWCARLLLISCANMDFPLGQCTNATPKQISADLEAELWFGEKVYTYHTCACGIANF